MTDLNYQKGLDALKFRNYQDAVLHFSKYLSFEKTSGAFQNRAYAYFNLGKKDLAKSDYESAVKIRIDLLKKADENNKDYINSCHGHLIDLKATIAHIELGNENFSNAENLYNELINLYNNMYDNTILRADLQVFNFFSNRAMTKLRLNKREEAALDLGVAYVESYSEKDKQEILFYAEMNGLLEKVKQNVRVHELLKENSRNQVKCANIKLDFIFKSSDHLLFKNGKHESGPHGGAGRAVKVEPNFDGEEGVFVTLYNLEGDHPIWQNNIQMSPKQMKLIQQDETKIILRGYGQDSMGGSFADYGLTIKLKNREIENCILHIYDKGVDIEYLP
jgi:tetratricopeptide (TPR) repeat protein